MRGGGALSSVLYAARRRRAAMVLSLGAAALWHCSTVMQLE
jgi:hypothetical protein